MKKISYAGYRFPTEIISQAIWLYLRFSLSLPDGEDLLAERGLAVSYEMVRLRGEPFRTDDRRRLAKASPETSHDVASRRGLSENRRPNGLPLAARRC
jgi:transposase-like protein